MTRPLSSINLALNRAAAGAGGDVDPENLGTLTVWFDPSDADARTISTAPNPDVYSRLENKAATDVSNDAEASDGIGGTNGWEHRVAEINSLDAGKADNTPAPRAMAVTDLVQTFSRVGSAGFRLFVVLQANAAPEDTQDGIAFQNGARDPSGGGYAFHMNRAADGSGTVRFQLYDESTSGNAVGTATIAAVDNDVNDGSPHVIMIGRSIGTGTAGVDELVGSIDGVVPTGLPVDLDAGLGDCDNNGATNAAAGWFILGAAAAAPNIAQRWMPVDFGEVLLYKTDMTPAQEAAVVSYLSSKWGV